MNNAAFSYVAKPISESSSLKVMSEIKFNIAEIICFLIYGHTPTFNHYGMKLFLQER